MARVRLSEDLRPLSDLKTQTDLQNSAESLELQRAIDGAERDMAEGHWVEHSEVKAKLKRWADRSAA